MNTLASAPLQYVLFLSCSPVKELDSRLATKFLMPLMSELEAASPSERQLLAQEAAKMLAFMEQDVPPGPSPDERTILQHFIDSGTGE